MGCDDEITALHVLATENNEFFVLEDGETHLLLYEEEVGNNECVKSIWLSPALEEEDCCG